MSTFLHTGDAQVVGTSIVAARNLVRDGHAAARQADARSARAGAAQNRAAALADRQSALEAQVAQEAADVRVSLAEATSALTQANAQVRALAAQVAAQRAVRDSNQFAQALAAASAANPQGSSGPPSSIATAALAAAKALQGKPYIWGGAGPAGYDCSGLVQTAYRAAGVSLPRTARPQHLTGPHVALADLRPGDLLFWATDTAVPGTIHHVAIYAGNGLMVSANHTGDVVRLQPVWWSEYIGATRPTAAA